MADSASLKIQRATKHIDELNELLRKTRPFALVVKTNTQTGERLVTTKKRETVVRELAIICGDAVHNLRCALDHAYWEIISPHCTTDKERRLVQFPFTSKASELYKTLHDALASRGGTGFYSVMRKLRTHGEEGGNEMLFLVRESDNLDKHRLLVPAINNTKVALDRLFDAVPDMPHIRQSNGRLPMQAKQIFLEFGDANFIWTNMTVPRDQLGDIVPGSLCLFERELNVPVEIVLQIRAQTDRYAMARTLDQMASAVTEAIRLMREGAASY